jgi:CheY-like chemotaxis protein
VSKHNPIELATKTEPRPHRVLLAEDDQEMRTLIGAKLRKDGYDVVELDSGVALLSAVTLARAQLAPMPSVVVTDVRMPRVSGITALQVIKGYGWDVPIIVITAFGSEETLNEVTRSGATMVLHKPFELDDLRRAIRCVLPAQESDGPPA